MRGRDALELFAWILWWLIPVDTHPVSARAPFDIGIETVLHAPEALVRGHRVACLVWYENVVTQGHHWRIETAILIPAPSR